MIAISCKNLSKYYGIEQILDSISLNVNEGDKIGIVGINGAGKSTFLKILSQEIEYDSGTLTFGKELSLGHLKQDLKGFKGDTVLRTAINVFEDIIKLEEEIRRIEKELADISNDELRIGELTQLLTDKLEEFKEKEGFSYQSKAENFLMKMGFEPKEFNKSIDKLSGGEKTRLQLTCLLLSKPDILLLDEPTNHLDIKTISWLEEFLSDYKKTVLIVSHDRYFLNKVANKIVEIENKKINEYSGNYAFYAKEKESRREAFLKDLENKIKEIKRQEDIIRRFKQHKTEKLAKRASSREKMLEVKKEEIPNETLQTKKKIALKFKEEYASGKDVLILEELSKSFGYGINQKELFKNLDFHLRRGEKICIVGDNGVGKTSLFKIIKGDISQTSGIMKLGHNVKIAYYDQQQELLNDDLTVIEELHSAYHLYSRGEIRGFLGMFAFKDDMIDLKVGSLSGGEKARLSLLKLMLQGGNLLLLDEPTNHLDIETKEIFERAILNFDGTVLIISHDRYLLDKVPDKILELSSDGVLEFLGKYDYYIEKKKNQETENISRTQVDSDKKEDDVLSEKEKRQIQKEKEREQKRLQREKENLEKDIENIEKIISEKEAELMVPKIMEDHLALQRISDELENLRKELEEKYERWLQ